MDPQCLPMHHAQQLPVCDVRRGRILGFASAALTGDLAKMPVSGSGMLLGWEEN
jgi:hypothetical protein